MREQSVERRVKSEEMTHVRYIAALVAFVAMGLLAGCRQDMHDEPKFFPQRGTEFYADGRSVRPQVENTVARGQMHEDSYFYSGLNNGVEGNTYPFPVTMDVLERGQERFNVYCTPCHSRVGNGEGMIVQRGYRPAGNFHTERLRTAPLGHFFSVMTNGYGAMPDYAAQLTPEDRWAVVAYIKALQLSQNATQAEMAGQQVQSLSDIANKEGLPPGFAHAWALPSTANVYGTPNGQDNGIPGQDKVTGPATTQAPKPAAAPRAPTTPASATSTPPTQKQRP
ncbi:MAG: cytochrome c [Acidobacteriaceae bacterium]